MFALWIAFVIGIVEGLTEFLPVSSTGHMILVGHLINFTGPKAQTFEIVIQLGAIMAVVVLYWRRVLRLFGIQDAETKAKPGPKLSLVHVFIGIVPVLALAFVLRDQVEKLFAPETVVIGLVVGGIFMIVGEKWHPPVQADDMDRLTYKQALYIGVAQCLSLWPGFSRSGATIAAGMLTGASRGASADFTFLMAIPVMAAATGYKLLKSLDTFTKDDIVFFGVGFVVSFVVALLAVATFIKLVSRLKLTYFSYYRFALALIVLLFINQLR